MSKLINIWLLVLAGIATCGRLQAQPPAGSQVPQDENFCAMCHTEADLWEGETLRLYVPMESLELDAHWQKGVNCHDCHGGNHESTDVGEAHATEDGFRPLEDVRALCGNCHQDQRVEMARGVHAKAGERDERDRGTPMACGKCHGDQVHGMLPVKDSRSPVFLDNQVKTCGGCHPEDMETYHRTVHGEGLYESGLLVTAVCADCHGAHGIYYAADRRSTLHATKVAETCGKCHYFIEEWLERSVHGGGEGPGQVTDLPAPGGRMQRKPSCTSCHLGHHLLRPDLADFQLEVVNRCGNCHADLSSRYAMSLHGELTHLGYEPAATCADCHGSHDILAVDDPESRLAAGTNRLKTCKKCHTNAVANFTAFDPHANQKDKDNYPRLYWIYHGTESLFFWLFVVFLVHAVLWFFRAFTHRLRYGRHKTLVMEQVALIRIDPVHRVLYAILLVSFLGLTITGLPLKFNDQQWARALARGLGGFETTRIWHHSFGVLALFGCTVHVARGATRIFTMRRQKVPWKVVLFGADSPVPGARDVKDLSGMVRWFFGLGRRPVFERWTYWEKLDYWAVYLAAVFIGLSGLMLWYPNLFCRFLPGSVLNVAKVIHAEVAILAASLVFFIHFFHTHFRPEKFPMDLSALTGMVSEEHLRKHRPEYVERLRRSGTLEEIRTIAPSRRRLWLTVVEGAFVFSLGLCLLVVILLASLGE